MWQPNPYEPEAQAKVFERMAFARASGSCTRPGHQPRKRSAGGLHPPYEESRTARSAIGPKSSNSSPIPATHRIGSRRNADGTLGEDTFNPAALRENAGRMMVSA